MTTAITTIELGDTVRFSGPGNSKEYQFAGWVKPDQAGYDCVLQGHRDYDGKLANFFAVSKLLERIEPHFRVGRTYIRKDRANDTYRYTVAALNGEWASAWVIQKQIIITDEHGGHKKTEFPIITVAPLRQGDFALYEEVQGL